MKIIIDRDVCVGSGQCVMTAPEVFDQDDEGISMAIDPEPPESSTEDVRTAADLCPSQAIRVID